MTAGPNDDRHVELFDEDLEILPDQTREDTGMGWGEWRDSEDDVRLLEERPPHW